MIRGSVKGAKGYSVEKKLYNGSRTIMLSAHNAETQSNSSLWLKLKQVS
jgi:hypothetical protein